MKGNFILVEGIKSNAESQAKSGKKSNIVHVHTKL